MMDAAALRLEHKSRSSKISLGNINPPRSKPDGSGPGYGFRHESGEAVVSGLPSADSPSLCPGTGECQGPVVATNTRTSDRDSPFPSTTSLHNLRTHQRTSGTAAFSELKTEAESAAGQFPALAGQVHYRMSRRF